MAVMDEFKEERAALKNAGFKAKFRYFLDYYKWHVIAGAAVLLMGGSLIYQMVNAKENVFFAVMMNSVEDTETAGQFRDGFIEYADIDSREYETVFDTSIRIDEGDAAMTEATVTSTQKFMVYVAAAELDILVTDPDSIRQYANSSYFHDLRDILSPEQLAAYEPYFYYVDQAQVDALEKARDDYDDAYVPDFPDPTKPEEMENPVPVGLYLDAAKLDGAYYFRTEDVVLSVFVNTKHLENALKFTDYVMEK